MNRLSRRAALQKRQEAEERAQRTKRLIIAGIAAAAFVVVAVLAVVLIQSLNRESGPVVAPPNATEQHGILVHGKAPNDSVPHLIIWEDYQCGGCAGVEAEFGPLIQQLVEEGKITAEHRQSHFLDGQATNGQSKRAALAAAAADQAGVFDEYHSALYAARMSGAEYSDVLLRDTVPQQLGLQGDELTTFQTAYDDAKYDAFVEAAQDLFMADQIGSTPTFLVGDNRVELFNEEGTALILEPTEESLMGAINEAAGR